MTWVAGSLSVLIVAFALLYVSPRLRKATFIWFTYLSLTCWYYFRLWEKRRNAGNSMSPKAKPKPKSTATTASSRRHDDDDVEDVVYFESAEKLLRQRELRHAPERSARLSGSSSSGNSQSGYSDDSLGRFTSTGLKQPKTHLGIFRSMHRSKTDNRSERGSELSQSDALARSTVSEPGTTTRRTYTGRKKPQSWGD